MTSNGAPIDLARFVATPVRRDPFDHVVVPEFVPPQALGEVARDFPRFSWYGSIPLNALDFGPAFARLVDALRSPEVTEAFAEKFDIDLTGRPTMITVRGHSRDQDGKIHTDSKTKLITVLIYPNLEWRADSGRLRLLRSAEDLDDYADEVLPAAGTLLAFRCTDTAWHGYRPFVGERRSVQLNWVTDAAVVRRETLRHGISTLSKRLLGRRQARP